MGAESTAPEQPSKAVTQYETLRGAALGDVLPLEARGGLMLFLRRGMWGWARAMATVTQHNRTVPRSDQSMWGWARAMATVTANTGTSQRSVRSPSESRTVPEECRAVIHILAAMAIHADNGGAVP